MRLGDEFDIRIVTLDHDLKETTPYPGIERNVWSPVDKARVMYLSVTGLGLSRLAGIVEATAPSVIYLNSFFDPTFTQRVLWARRIGWLKGVPVVIAPRGEFSVGALGLKAWKKALYLRVAQFTGLYNDLIWQASTALEYDDIRRALPFARADDIQVVKNLPSIETGSATMQRMRQPGDPLRICFMSRISPMKNLDFALRALALVRAKVLFTIYGPREDPAYWSICKSLMSALPSNVSVFYAGELHPSDVNTHLAQHDLFFFPTLGENYGHVIHEALSAGLPVLISDQTPWGGVVEREAGWVLPLDNAEAYARQIDLIGDWDHQRLERTRIMASTYAAEVAFDPGVIEANRRMFLHACGLVKG